MDRDIIHIKNIIEAIQSNKVRISDHADEEAEADQLTFDEIYFSVFRGEIIEDYPEDKPYPSCLIFGKTSGAILYIAFGRIINKLDGLLL